MICKKSMLSVLLVFCVPMLLGATISIPIPSGGLPVKTLNGEALFSEMPAYGEPGYPLLPSKEYTLLVPPDADLSTVSFHLEGMKETELAGRYAVKPASPPYSIEGPVWPQNRNIVNGRDIAVYGSDAFYPDTYIQDISVHMMRCYKIVKARLYFYKYNPVSGTLKALTGGRLVLDVKRRSSGGEASYTVPAKFRKLAQKLVMNYAEAGPAYDSEYSFTNKSGYVIMTESGIITGSKQFEALKKSKQDHGFTVKVLTESDWGGGTGNQAAENMKKWLQANYKEMGIEYVLLIGDPNSASGKVPMKKSQRNTDFYYSELTGPWENDVLAEVSASRIPVYGNDYTTLDKILTKVITYENTPAKDIGWRTFCFIAEKPYDSQTPGYPLFEAIKTKFLDPNKWGNYRIYDVSTGNPDESSCTETAVKNAWMKLKFGLMLWMTHGSATGASSIMKSSTMEGFTDEFPSIVYMGSCSNASISTSTNLTYTALRKASIGAIGGTDITWYGDAQIDKFEGTSTTQGLLYQFAQGITDSLGAGDALNYAIGRCTDKKWWINIEGYVLYGCPEIGVFTCAGTTPVSGGALDFGTSAKSARFLPVTDGAHMVHFLFMPASSSVTATLAVYDLSGKEIYGYSDLRRNSYNACALNTLCLWDLTGNSVHDGMYIAALQIRNLETGNVTVINRKITVNRK